MSMTPAEARAALTTLDMTGSDPSWSTTHRDEMLEAYDRLLAFVADAERQQAELTALHTLVEHLTDGWERTIRDVHGIVDEPTIDEARAFLAQGSERALPPDTGLA